MNKITGKLIKYGVGTAFVVSGIHLILNGIVVFGVKNVRTGR